MDIKVSIIVPVYNVKHYLRRCVDSLLAQTLRDIEIILIDDGSTDGSEGICDEYAFEYEQIRVVHQNNEGPSVARNKGMELSKGKYILFVDSDDYILPESCFTLFNLAEKYRCQIVRGNGKSINDQFQKPYRVAPVFNEPVLGVKFLCDMIKNQHVLTVCPPFGLYRREFLINNKLFFEKGLLYEDELWMPQVYLKAERIISTNYYFYFHWIVSNSRSNCSWTPGRKKAIYKICQDLYVLYQEQEKTYFHILCDSLATLYLNAVNLSRDKKANRIFAIKTADSWFNYIKAILFFVSPALYFKIHHLHQKLYKGKL